MPVGTLREDGATGSPGAEAHCGPSIGSTVVDAAGRVWRVSRFGDLKAGDRIPDERGEPVVVSRVYGEHVPESAYEFQTSLNGARGSFTAGGNHLFYVETDVDRDYHRTRVRRARRALRGFRRSGELFDVWAETATARPGDLGDTALSVAVADVASAEGSDRSAVADVLVRAAASIGHVVETTIEDGSVVRGYDSVALARQVLALASRRWARKWPVVVGRVVDSAGLADLLDCGAVVRLPSPPGLVLAVGGNDTGVVAV